MFPFDYFVLFAQFCILHDVLVEPNLLIYIYIALIYLIPLYLEKALISAALYD